MDKQGTMRVTFKSDRGPEECAWEPEFHLRFTSNPENLCGALRVAARIRSGCIDVGYVQSYAEAVDRVLRSVKLYGKVTAWEGADGAWWKDSEAAEKLVAHYADEAARLGYPVPSAEVLDAARMLGWAFEAAWKQERALRAVA